MQGSTNTERALFASVQSSVRHGRRMFPTRRDYERAAIDTGLVQDADALWQDARLAASAARHWQGTGQPGCLFDRLLAREADDSRWPTVVLPELSPGAIRTVEQTLADAVAEPTCDLVSLLFPVATSVEEVRRIATLLSESPSFEVFETREESGHVIVAVRARLNSDGLVAWAMAFGPFDDWPATRRGPALDLVMRVKPKPAGIFHKLNQDPNVAHLADIRIDQDEEAFERLYQGSKKATRDVLGTETGLLGAARTTFSFPAATWDADGPSGLPVGRLEATRHPDEA
jgi:hypothetical protein